MLVLDYYDVYVSWGGSQPGVNTDLGGLAGAVMVGLMDDVIDDHLGNFPRHLLLGLRDTNQNL